MTLNLNERQGLIVLFAKENDKFQTKDVFLVVKKKFDVERLTIVRDLSFLEKNNVLKKQGKGRAISYSISKSYFITEEIDVNQYFKKEADDRNIKKKFNFEIFDNIEYVFTDNEKKQLKILNDIYQDKIDSISKDLLKKEIERMNIDFSWKSSKIEGNTYTLLETEQLMKKQQTAAGHTQDEATMILNHKKTLEYIRDNKEQFKTFTINDIENIHALLTNKLEITGGIRKRIVHIIGTNYVPLDNEFQIKEAVSDTTELISTIENPFEKSVLAMLFIAYIQPFIDGNKRTSRLSGNAILLAHDCCPLSYRSVDDIEYKKAMLLFYEQNNISYFKKIFIEQFEFAVENYF